MTGTPNWLEKLERDVLAPYRDLAARHPFYLKMREGKLAQSQVLRYLYDTFWAVTDFPKLAKHIALRAPTEEQATLEVIAAEELDHPELFARALSAFQGEKINEELISRYRPSPLYRLWWEWIRDKAYNAPWIHAVAAIMVGVESLARVQENIVGTALTQFYGLSETDAAWFLVHGGEEEEEHGALGLQLLERNVPKDAAELQGLLTSLVQDAALPLLFDYPNYLLTLNAQEVYSTPAEKHLQALGIPYRMVPHPQGISSSADFAKLVGIPLARVFKTLLLKSSDQDFVLCSLPADRKVTMSGLADAAGVRDLAMAPAGEINRILNTPNVTPFTEAAIGLQFFLDSHALDEEVLYIGSGVPGFDVEIRVIDLLLATKPRLGKFAAS